MKVTTAETKIEYIDPLTSLPLRERDRVTLTSGNGIVSDFMVESVNKDSSIVLTPLGRVSTKASLKPLAIGDSVEIFAFTWFGDKKLKADEMVLLQTRRGKTKYWVDHALRDGYILLRPTEKPGKIGFINRLLLVKRSFMP